MKSIFIRHWKNYWKDYWKNYWKDNWIFRNVIIIVIIIGCCVADTLDNGSCNIVDDWESADGTDNMECCTYDLADGLGFRTIHNDNLPRLEYSFLCDFVDKASLCFLRTIHDTHQFIRTIFWRESVFGEEFLRSSDGIILRLYEFNSQLFPGMVAPNDRGDNKI